MLLIWEALDQTQIEVGNKMIRNYYGEQAKEMPRASPRSFFSRGAQVAHLQGPGLYGSLQTTKALEVALLVRVC